MSSSMLNDLNRVAALISINEEVHDLYRIAINKIDDYFEYSYNSSDDQDMVRSILKELNDGVEEVFKS